MARKYISFFAFVGVVYVDCSKWVKLPAIERVANIETQNESVKTLVELSDEMFLVQNRNVPHENIFYNASFDKDMSKIGNQFSDAEMKNLYEIKSNSHPRDSELSNKTIKSDMNSNENVGFYNINKLSSFFKHLQTNMFNNIPTTLKEKMKFLKNMHDNILINIENRLDLLWPTGATSRGMKDNDHHLDFPSAESALMTISFLTFAVYLIKLVLQVINILKMKKTTMYTPMVTSAARELVYDQRLNFNYDNMQILNLMQSLKSK